MTEFETIERDEVDRQNRDALIALVAKHGLWIGRKEFDKWRPTTPTAGEIDGFFEVFPTMTCIATDGVQAWFLLPNGDALIGHVKNFHWGGNSGAPGPLYRTSKEKESKPKPKRKSVLQKALEMLGI
jgi:hypothetical protein